MARYPTDLDALLPVFAASPPRPASTTITRRQDAPRNDVYTGLLAISFVTMMVGSWLLLLDWYQYSNVKPAPVLLPPVKVSSLASR